MTYPVTPPLFGEAPGLTCSRWLTDHNCGKPGVSHVMWDATGENGIVCAEHVDEIGTQWVYLDQHPYDPECSIGGALWLWGNPSRCIHEDILVAEKAALARSAS